MALLGFLSDLFKGNSSSNKTSSRNNSGASNSSYSGSGRYYSNNPYASQTNALVTSNNNTTTTKPTTSVPSVSATQKALQEQRYQTTDSKGNTVTINGTQHKQSQIAEDAGMKQPTTYTKVDNSTPLGITPAQTTPSSPTNTTPTTTVVDNPVNDDPVDEEIVYDYDISYPTRGYAGGGGGGGSSSSSLDLINQLYEAKRQQAIAAIQNAMDNAIAGYEASIDALPQAYDPLRAQSEYERYKSQKALEEQLANSGNTYSGMGRQDTLNLQNTYTNQLNELNQSEQNEKEELQRLIEQTRRDGEFHKANAGYDFDIAAYQAALNQQSEDREYEWMKYLQEYQEKQDALDREFNTQKYYDSLANNYKPSTSGSTSSSSTPSVGTSSNTSYQLSGNNANQIANYNTKTAVNEAVNNLQMNGVNDGNAEYAEEVIKAYYIKNGKYPTTENVDKFVAKYNELKALGKEFTEDDIANYCAALNFTPYETILAYTIYGGN